MKNKNIEIYWDNYEHCKNECAKYSYLRNLRRYSTDCYNSLLRNNWIDVFYPIKKKKKHKWDVKENCTEKVKNYKTFGDFVRLAYEWYIGIKENGWLQEICGNMPKYKEYLYWSDYQNCEKEFQKFKSLKILKKYNRDCYNAILRNGWKNDFLAHNDKFVKEFGYWNNIEHCIEESKKYTTITELKDKSNGCYASVLKHHWENDCFPDFKKRKPNGYWDIKENCMEEAKKYRNISEFQKCAYGAYNCAKKNGWIEEIDSLYNKTIMYHSYDEKIHSVYIYLLEEDKVFYVGRTNGLKRRHQQHIRDCNDTLNKYCKSKGIEIPNYVILKEELTAQESQYYEDFYLNDYKQKGWTPLNIAVTGINKGSLGATCKWNYEECKEFCKSYKYKSELKEANYQCYATCLSNGWFNDFGIIDKKKYPNGYWSIKEHCLEIASKCENKTEFVARWQGAYKSSVKHDWIGEIDEIFSLKQ